MEAAHIYPKRLDGGDDVRNGICLCRLHYWALYVGWITITPNCTVVVRDSLPLEEYQPIRAQDWKPLRLPNDDGMRPADLFAAQHRIQHEFAEPTP